MRHLRFPDTLLAVRSTFRARLTGGVIALALGLSSLAAHAFVWPNVPERIARSLTSTDVSERRAAAKRIAELPGELGLPLAQKALADGDIEVRLLAASAATTFSMPRAGDYVIGWLGEGDARLRRAACDVIRAAPTDRSVVALGRVLGDPDSHVRVAAAAAMGSSGLPDAVSPLLGHLDDGAFEVRAEVARALGRLGDARAVVPLIGKVQDTAVEVRRAVARALGELGDARATSALVIALQDGSQDVRIEAVKALGKLHSDEATAAIVPLIEVAPVADALVGLSAGGLRSGTSTAGSLDVRVAAIEALGRIGSEGAVRALIAALAKDDPSALRSPVRLALVAAGKPAVPQLVAALSGAPSPTTAAGAALVLGALHAKEGLDPTVRAMQRGALPLEQGLRALSALGSPDALPAVLELLSDTDPAVRREAVRAASELLDPAKPDGRAVDPARAMLLDATTPNDEKVSLVRLLGRTGSPRAQTVLVSLTSSKSRSLRLAVLDALGASGKLSPEVETVLLQALDDESPEVRMAAAASLARGGGPEVAGKLLDRLSVAAEQDRGALSLALSGALARSTDWKLAERVGNVLASTPESARDGLIEGVARMQIADGRSRGYPGGVLRRAALLSLDDRRKVAEACGGHAGDATTLRSMLGDADPSVRANAVWSLGHAAGKEDIPKLLKLLSDPDVAVAGNAAGALGRIAVRQSAGADVRVPLCAALADGRPYVRANALTSLGLAGQKCDAGIAEGLLLRDRSEAVRLAAANHLWNVYGGTNPLPDNVRRLFARCASEDHSAQVALQCTRPPEKTSGTDDVLVFVAPAGSDAPQSRAPYALVRGDGLIRMGMADRRGGLFEFAAPKGILRLAVPAQLAR